MISIIDELQEATKGLLFPSESDEPFDVLQWPEMHGAPSKEGILQRACESGVIARETPLDEFFKVLTTEGGSQDKEEKEQTARFKSLVKLLGERLRNVTVVSVGGVRVRHYIIGRLPNDGWCGIKTLSVET